MIDLRSDTVTRPTAAMREAMFAAAVGDDVYGEDPAANDLEEYVAALVGHEAALWCPTGSMANMLGIAAQVQPGAEVLTESRAHIVRAESGGHAALGGVTSRTWISPAGQFKAAQALELLSEPRGYVQVGTSAIAVENTHNFWGGRTLDMGELRALYTATRETGVAVHMDGARLANAAVAQGETFQAYGALTDSISICLSKGLGAPAGSVLTGTAEVIGRARALRKRYGGGMRQIGFFAAAGRYALDHHVARLQTDHDNARRLAGVIAQHAPGSVDARTVETNIVFIDTRKVGAGMTAQEFAHALAQHDVLVSVMSASAARIVTHYDMEDDVEQAAAALDAVLSSL